MFYKLLYFLKIVKIERYNIDNCELLLQDGTTDLHCKYKTDYSLTTLRLGNSKSNNIKFYGDYMNYTENFLQKALGNVLSAALMLIFSIFALFLSTYMVEYVANSANYQVVGNYVLLSASIITGSAVIAGNLLKNKKRTDKNCRIHESAQ